MANASDYVLWTSVLVILTNAFSWFVLKYLADLSDLAKRGIVAVIVFGLAGAESWYAGTLDLSDIGRSWLVVFLIANGLWLVLWKPLADGAKGPPAEGIT